MDCGVFTIITGDRGGETQSWVKTEARCCTAHFEDGEERHCQGMLLHRLEKAAEPLEAAKFCQHFGFNPGDCSWGFWPPEVQEDKPVLYQSHQICDRLLQQPQKSNTPDSIY